MTERFNSKEIAIEMSYNIKDACTRYRNNYEINLFWQILTGQIEENVYHYEMKEYARILQYLIKLLPNLASLSVCNFNKRIYIILQTLEIIFYCFLNKKESKLSCI